MTPHPAAPDELELDRLFSDFFKSQLKRPWPNAPFPLGGGAQGTGTQGAVAPAEPSELAATRSLDTPRNQPTPANRDNTANARFTLAASVALLLGTCWYLSNGLPPGERPAFGPKTPRVPLLQDGGASGTDHAPLQKMQEDKAKGNDGKGGTKIDLGKFE